MLAMKLARQGGYTLTELIAAGAIALVLAATAVPNFAGMLDALAMRSATDELFAAVQHTRAQAIALNTRVMLAPVSGDDDWAQGWAVFVDLDQDRRPGEGDRILMQRGPLKPGIRISGVFSTQASPAYLAYNGVGRACSATSSTVARFGTFTLRQDESVRRINISMAGRARVCDPARDDDCGGNDDAP